MKINLICAQINDTERMVEMVFDKRYNRLTVSGRDADGPALMVDLKAVGSRGLLPGSWRALDRVSCNSSYDRCVRGQNTE